MVVAPGAVQCGGIRGVCRTAQQIILRRIPVDRNIVEGIVAARDQMLAARFSRQLDGEDAPVRHRENGVRQMRAVVGERHGNTPPGRVRERVAADAILCVVEA